MQYYGNRLSENISRREPEGYLLCLNVPVARTGTQDYLPEERVTVTVSRLASEGENTDKRLITYDIPYIKAAEGQIENISI